VWPGKYHLQVCTCVPCCLVGGTELLEHTEKKLDIHAGHTTEDGFFSIEEMECIGACSFAPAIIVNEDYFENVTPETIDKMIDEMRK
jgi:NADH:ubiquinone oxidoreductase subunit E